MKDHYQTITEAIERIIARKTKGHSFTDLASTLGLSESHLRKLFIEWVGISPKQFSRYLTTEYAKELLAERSTSLTTTIRTGLSSGGRLHDLFVVIEAITPGEYQNGGRTLVISYSTFPTMFGSCLVASTSRGICNILFFDDLAQGVADLRSRWPKAQLEEKRQPSHDVIQEYFSDLTPRSKIKLHVHGTNFQIKVWEALLSIPDGSVTNYGTIARELGAPRLSQAVGGAVGDNPVGYIIPCHRVLKSTGEISGYRWGVTRKRSMLVYEAIQREAKNPKL